MKPLSTNPEELEKWILDLIEHNNVHEFYNWRVWRKLAAEVLKEQKYECQVCKARGILTKATTVHHVNYLRNSPMLSLSKFDYEGKRNLIAICEQCHYDEHHRNKNKSSGKRFYNSERW